MCKSTLRHIYDCNLQNEAVNCSEMLVRFCVLPRQTISGHSSPPSLPPTHFTPLSVTLRSVFCFSSPEDENSVFSRFPVIDFIWGGDGNSSKTCQWCCAYYANVKTVWYNLFPLFRTRVFVFCFIPLSRLFSVIRLMCSALMPLFRPFLWNC